VFVEQGLVAGRLDIELDGARPALLAADMHDEAGGGIDLARGADRQEEAAALQDGVDLVHVQRHLAEPHDVWPELAHGLAVGADRLRREVDVGLEHLVAIHAANLAVAAVHVDDVLRARHLVQRVDVLGDDRDFALVFLLQPRQRAMGRIGLDMGGAEGAAGLVVEVEHLLLVAVPGLDRGDLLEIDPVPQPVLVAERVDAAFLGDAGAGQDHDTGRQEVLMHAHNLASCQAGRP
jgi:hypothetical protein